MSSTSAAASPRSAARALDASTSACEPRGPAPKRTRSRTSRGRLGSCGRVARPRATARSTAASVDGHARHQRLQRPHLVAAEDPRHVVGLHARRAAGDSRAPRPRSGTRRGSRAGSGRAAPRASGYVPSCSMGLRVAKTWNGSGSGGCCVPTVTRRSCIACSSAACVFGGVRLISSASTRLWKMGPGRNRTARPAPPVFLEHVGAGDVGGQEVGRELHAPERQLERLGQRRHEQRLGEARHADEQRVTARQQRDEHQLDDLLLARPRARRWPRGACGWRPAPSRGAGVTVSRRARGRVPLLGLSCQGQPTRTRGAGCQSLLDSRP